jgi:2-amino-4-hydroxy-6-hydroxymethyldihydropteridine diphosphokinase
MRHLPARSYKELRLLVNFSQSGSILLALGGNAVGAWGAPQKGLRRACLELEAAGLTIVAASRLYETDPVGGGWQAPYLNAVIIVHGSVGPTRLLRLAKDIERRAGRRPGPPLSARPVDVDVLDFGGRRLNWPPSRRERGRLILPHPLLHTRSFVLVPLTEVAPHWLHPVLRCHARTLLARLPQKVRAGVRQALDFRIRACEKAGR